MGKTLAQRVATRSRFLDTIVHQLLDLVEEHGRRTLYEQHSCNTHIVRELESFGGFSFKSDTGQSMMGGNDLYVWAIEEDRRELVLRVHWVPFAFNSSHDDTEVKTFSEDAGWQQQIKRLPKRQKAIIDKRKEEAAKNSTVRSVQKKKAAEKTALGKKAERLGIRV